jgi:hypothetical protein
MKTWALPAVLALTGFGAASCSALRQELLYQGLGAEEHVGAEIEGLQVQDADLRAAYARWPWIRDPDQLRRRALLLKLNPSPADIAQLDQRRDEAAEVRVLAKLLPAR